MVLYKLLIYLKIQWMLVETSSSLSTGGVVAIRARVPGLCSVDLMTGLLLGVLLT